MIEYGYRKVDALRIVIENNFKGALRQGFEMSPGVIRVGRAKATSDITIQQASVEKPKQWLSDCEHSHQATCQEPRAGTHTTDPVELSLMLMKDVWYKEHRRFGILL